MKVMIVDDNPGMCRAISRLVIKAGFEAITMSDSKDFIDVYTKHKPDLLFLDLNMPGDDGIRLLRKLQKSDLDGSVYLISGEDPSVVSSSFKLAKQCSINVVEILQKPLDWAHIMTILTTAKIRNEASKLDINTIKNTDSDGQDFDRFSISVIDILEGMKQLQIRMNYQPKISLASGEVVGVEALARWIHPTMGIIPPMTFIQYAEKLGVIADLTFYLFAFALTDFNIIRKKLGNIHLSFNVSALMLEDEMLPDKLENHVQTYGLDTKNIILEITESAASTNKLDAMEIISRFRMKGFGVSLDDYGTGFSTLAQLLDFPFSEIKIDRSFVMALSNEGKNEAEIIVESTLDMASKFKMKTVAEGIESSEIMAWLKSHGCNEGQGYHICRPQSMLNLIKWFDDYSKTLNEENSIEN